MVGALLSAGLSGVESLVGSIVNYANQQEQKQYDRNLQQTIFNREDNAVQRRANDLEAAGLSKTLAAGSAAGAGAPIKISAPELKMDSVMSALQSAQQVANIKKTQAETDLAEQNKKYLDEMNPKKLKAQELENIYGETTLSERIAKQGVELTNSQIDSQLKMLGVTEKQINNAILGYKRLFEKRMSQDSVWFTQSAQLITEAAIKDELLKQAITKTKNDDFNQKWWNMIEMPSNINGDIVWRNAMQLLSQMRQGSTGKRLPKYLD